MLHLFARILLCMAVAMIVTPIAAAQNFCGERARILGGLAAGYGEVPVAIGLQPDGTIVELIVAPSGSWTLLVTAPTGRSCALGAGEAWQPHPAQTPVPGA